jgi:hypothetical protein
MNNSKSISNLSMTKSSLPTPKHTFWVPTAGERLENANSLGSQRFSALYVGARENWWDTPQPDPTLICWPGEQCQSFNGANSGRFPAGIGCENRHSRSGKLGSRVVEMAGL